MLILTNNPRVQQLHPSADYLEGSPQEVFARAEDMVLRGYALHTHPIPANQRLCGSPFRTLLLQEPGGQGVHKPSLMMLSRARELFSRATPLGIDDKAREDLAYLDWEHFDIEVQKLPQHA